MNLSVINDCHVGAIRSGGTTPASAFNLRSYLCQRFKALLYAADGDDLLILGDLFDTFSVPYMDVLFVYFELQRWLDRNEGMLHLVPGNHDLSKTTSTMSSFQFLCKLLWSHPRVKVHGVPGPITVAGNTGWVIPHMDNQDIFDLKLSEVPEVKYLFLHCNFDNKFARESDHSLNLDGLVALKLPVEKIIMAHEHQRSSHINGKVLVPGNQIPSSVADCLGNDAKYMTVIHPDKVELLPVWERENSFGRVDWRDLLKADTAQINPALEFIRVEGEAQPDEVGTVATTISKLRKVHNAFVITNAVEVEGRSFDGEKISLEQIQGFDILGALLRRLSPEQQKVVTKLMEENNVQAN
jgi:metallophosphoesterase superfamily enzyme